MIDMPQYEEVKNMRSKYNFPNQHPLKDEIRQRRIKLWQLRDLTGISESKMSRYLNGVEPMPERVERLIIRCIKVLYC